MSKLPERLIKGYMEFKSGRFVDERQSYEMLAEKGQQPEIMLIGCSDSRAAPSTIFNAGPGEMFVVRNVANIVPDRAIQEDGIHGTAAALEFAVNGLKVKHIVIMGHGRCGGIKAYIDEGFEPLSEGDYIGRWTGQLEPANSPERLASLNRPDLDHQGLLERASIIKSIENMLTYACVRKKVEAGELALYGAWFDISDGTLEFFDSDEGTFRKVDADTNGLRD